MDMDRGVLEVDILPPQREQFAAAQAGERRCQVNCAVLPIFFGTERPLGLADGWAARVAMCAVRGGGDEHLDLLRREEVETPRIDVFAQPSDLRGDVDSEVEAIDCVLEDGVGLGRDLVDRLARTCPILGQSVTPPLELFRRDRLDAARPELGKQVGVEHRAVVALGRGRPVSRQRPACVPVLGNVRERDAGALLA
jgi:hypothetical protein